MEINNRRYTGSKYKLSDWIKLLLIENCKDCKTFFDVFGGTGVVTANVLDLYENFVINDFLYSNEIIYKAFFLQKNYNLDKLIDFADKCNTTDKTLLSGNYVSDNYGDKYFELNAAKLIGFIREEIEILKNNAVINDKEYYILLASLLYSFDKCANTVGHYEAYIKNKPIDDNFCFELIHPFNLENKTISIHRQDANILAKEISSDIVFLDPPYNSRQYSRFYHVMETIAKWNKPILHGTAMKPPEENMSDYCRSNAPAVFEDLIKNLNTKYIVVTYNNTYNSKSSSSKNKITLEQIRQILLKRGATKYFEKEHRFFNAGKTNFNNHKEFLFITEVDK